MRFYEYARNGRMAQALRYYPVLSKNFEEWLLKYTRYVPVLWKKDVDKKRLLHINTVNIFDLDDIESYEKCVVEYISGMTDVFAINIYEEIISF